MPPNIVKCLAFCGQVVGMGRRLSGIEKHKTLLYLLPRGESFCGEYFIQMLYSLFHTAVDIQLKKYETGLRKQQQTVVADA